MMGNALTLMLIGMGVVFIFLVLMILMIQVSSRVIRWLEARRPAPPAGPSGSAGPDRSRDIAVAVAAAQRRA